MCKGLHDAAWAVKGRWLSPRMSSCFSWRTMEAGERWPPMTGWHNALFLTKGFPCLVLTQFGSVSVHLPFLSPCIRSHFPLDIQVRIPFVEKVFFFLTQLWWERILFHWFHYLMECPVCFFSLSLWYNHNLLQGGAGVCLLYGDQASLREGLSLQSLSLHWDTLELWPLTLCLLLTERVL